MTLQRYIKQKFTDITGYWTYKQKHLPVGTDPIVDLKKKIQLNLTVIFDVGANNGQTAIKYAKYFPAARVYSFEPISNTFKQLQENTAAYKNVSGYKIALGDKNETIQVKVFTGKASVLNSLNTSAMNSNEGAVMEDVTVETLDHFIAKNNIGAIDLLKIDTEGYELNVLRGAAETLKSNKVKLIYAEVGFTKVNKRNTYFASLVEFMEEAGYTFYGLYEISHVQLPKRTHYGNALFVNNGLLGSLKRWQQ